jgi:hypothetical protein
VNRVTFVALVLVCGCGARTMLRGEALDASAPNDSASYDSGATEVGTAEASSGCHPLPYPTTGLTKECEAWAQSLTSSGYAHTEWVFPGRCVMGDNCFNDDQGHRSCYCGQGTSATQCGGDEVCVSDTPDGSATCRKMCVSTYCGVGCTTTPSCLCGNAYGVDVCPASGRVCYVDDAGGLGPNEGCVASCP